MKFTLLLLTSLYSAVTSADIYKCTNSAGKKVYSSVSCSDGFARSEINIKSGSSLNLDEQYNQQIKKQKEQEAKLEQEKLEKELLAQTEAQLKQDASKASAENQLLIKNNRNDFSAFAIPPYDPDQLTPLVKKYRHRLPEIEHLRGLAAQKALASGQCIRVEASELHAKSTKDALMFLVDCSSGKQLYFNEQELAK